MFSHLVCTMHSVNLKRAPHRAIKTNRLARAVDAILCRADELIVMCVCVCV